MTREEAIGIMKVIIHMLEEKYDTDRVEDAVDLAIEALSAESCEDCISRQAVMNLMRGLTRWGVRSEDGKFNNVGLLYDDVMFGLDRLPPVTPKQSDMLEKIRAEIIEYEGNCRLSEDEYQSCKQCTDSVFETIYGIIDKYKAESEG